MTFPYQSRVVKPLPDVNVNVYATFKLPNAVTFPSFSDDSEQMITGAFSMTNGLSSEFEIPSINYENIITSAYKRNSNYIKNKTRKKELKNYK